MGSKEKKMKKIDVTFADDIANEIRNIDEAMQILNKSDLQFHTIVLLIQRTSGENQTTVRRVLNSLTKLKQDYLK